MIRPLTKTDINEAIKIVNDNWQDVYQGYVNPELLTEDGCQKRKERMTADLLSKRLLNYVHEYEGKVTALLSIGDTADKDQEGSFEIWRVYIAKEFQHKGIGDELINFAEKYALSHDYQQIVIWAFKENHNAISFYVHHGYKIDKEEYLVYPYLSHAIRLVKRIV